MEQMKLTVLGCGSALPLTGFGHSSQVLEFRNKQFMIDCGEGTQARAVRYHLLYVPLSFLYDVLALVLCWFFFFYAPSLMGSTGVGTILLGLSLTVAVYIVLQALKLTFISSWMPYAVENKKVLAGWKDSFTLRGKFVRRFVSYLLAIYLMVVINVVCGFCTLGSFLLITLPASAIYLLWLQLVLYYHENGRKYYLHARKVVGDAEDMPVESEIDLDLES